MHSIYEPSIDQSSWQHEFQSIPNFIYYSTDDNIRKAAADKLYIYILDVHNFEKFRLVCAVAFCSPFIKNTIFYRL